MANTEHPSLSQVVAWNLRALRDRATPKLSQDDLATAARSVGLPWTRSSVAALEFGRKRLTLDESMLLPLVCRKAFGRTVELAELVMPGARRPTLADGVTCEVQMPWRVVSGKASEVSDDDISVAGAAPVDDDREAWALRKRVWPRATKAQLAAAVAEQFGDAERNVATRLGVSADLVAVAAHKRWGHGLSRERDLVVGDQQREGELAQLRGRATRGLMAAIADELRAAHIIGDD